MPPSALYADELSAHLDPAAPQVVRPIENLTLTPQENSATVDLSSVFSAANDEPLTYEIISPNSAAVKVNLEENNLQLNAGNVTANTPVTVRAIDSAGNIATHTFAVTTNTWNSETIQAVDTALADVAAAINPEDIITSFVERICRNRFCESGRIISR